MEDALAELNSVTKENVTLKGEEKRTFMSSVKEKLKIMQHR
jgi:hypothetical protein